jgi:hypothetical protein
LLPAFPAVALLIGLWFAEVSNWGGQAKASTGRLALRIYAWALVIVFVALGAFLTWASFNLEELIVGRDMNSQQLEVARLIPVPMMILGVTLIVSAIVIGLTWKRGGNGATLLSIGGTHVLIYVVILAFVFPTFEPTKTYEPQSRWISAQIDGESRFGMVDYAGVPRRGGFAYYTDTDVDLLEGIDEATDFLRRYPKTIVRERCRG